MTNNIKIAHIQTKEEKFNAALDAAVETTPALVTIHRSIYNQMIKEEYTEEQSFDFATKFILEIVKGNLNDNSK